MMTSGHHTGTAAPRHPAFAQAGGTVAALVRTVAACDCRHACPLARPVRAEIAPAVAAGAAESLWRSTLEHAQTALACQRHCPAVDMLRAVLDATRPAYRAVG